MSYVKMASCLVLLTMLFVTAIAEECRLRGPVYLSRILINETLIMNGFFMPRILVERLDIVTQYNSSNCVNGICEMPETLLEAPNHFHAAGWSMEEIPLERLEEVNGVFLNVTEQAAGNASFLLQPAHIDAWLERHGPFPDNTLLLVGFGWAQRFDNRTLYLGTDSDDPSDFRSPGMTQEAARKLAGFDQIVGVGVDTFSVDGSGSSEAYMILAAKNIYILEHVNLDQPCLPAKGFQLALRPKKIRSVTLPIDVILLPT